MNTATMTPDELRLAVESLGTTPLKLSRSLSVGVRTVYRWLDGSVSIPGPASGLIRVMVERAAAEE